MKRVLVVDDEPTIRELIADASAGLAATQRGVVAEP
jgi:CheY-like chemotaxis protein